MNKTRRNAARKRRAAASRLEDNVKWATAIARVNFSRLMGAVKDVYPPYYFEQFIPNTLPPEINEGMRRAREAKKAVE